MWLSIIISCVAGILIIRTLVGVARRRDKVWSGLFWIVAWCAVIVVFWQPEVASYLAARAGIGRGADLVIYSAILVVAYLLYRFYIRIERMERNITTLTRELALRNSDEHKNSRRSDPVL